MCFHFVIDVSILSFQSTTSKLGSSLAFFVQMNKKISKLSQLVCLGFLTLILKEFKLTTSHFDLFFQGELNVFVMFTNEYQMLSNFFMHFKIPCFCTNCLKFYFLTLFSYVHLVCGKQEMDLMDVRELKLSLIVLIVGAIW